MSETLTATAPRKPVNALGRALGLSQSETVAMGDLFVEVLGRFGLQGRPIFERMSQGQPLAQALEVPQGTADVLYARAHQWFSVGRRDKAESLFRALCVISGDVADHWLGYGICLKMRGLLPEAEQAFTTGAALRPDWAIPYFHLAEIFIRSGEWQRAQQAMAAFDNRLDEATPEPVIAEAERFRIAIALRSEEPARQPVVAASSS